MSEETFKTWLADWIVKQLPEDETVQLLVLDLADILVSTGEDKAMDFLDRVVAGQVRPAMKALLKGLEVELIAASYDKILDHWRAANKLNAMSIARQREILRLLLRALIAYGLSGI